MMKSNLNLTLYVVLLLLVGGLHSSFDIPEASAGWERLGTRMVNYKLDRDVIRITRNEGTFKKLKIRVTGGAVNMHKVVVQYANGKQDIIPLRHTFGRRSSSRTIDLRGAGRFIRDVTFYYDTKDISTRRAKVHLYGR